MVLQVMSRATRGNAPERKRDGIWLLPTTNGSTKRMGTGFPSLEANDQRPPPKRWLIVPTAPLPPTRHAMLCPKSIAFKIHAARRFSRADTQNLRRRTGGRHLALPTQRPRPGDPRTVAPTLRDL